MHISRSPRALNQNPLYCGYPPSKDLDLRIQDVASDFILQNIYRFNQIRYPKRPLFRLKNPRKIIRLDTPQ